MSVLRGTPSSPGYARGVVFLFRPPDIGTVPPGCILPAGTADEGQRFRDAVDSAARQLELLQEQVRNRLGDSSAAIFDAHSGLLHDPAFGQGVERRIFDDHLTAEYAVALEIAALEQMFASLGSEYMRERTHDLRDIGNRLVRNLSGDATPQLARLPSSTIVVARSLTPTDTILLDPERVVAIVTEKGGRNSHAAILARSLGIPSVAGVPDVLDRLQNGQRVLVDGTKGTITADASESAIRKFSRHASNWTRTMESTRTAESGECITKDGVRIRLYANISRAVEGEELHRFSMDGIGLLRTELLFADARHAPRLDRQSSLYQRLARAAGSSPMVARTFDFGDDKLPPFLHGTDGLRSAPPVRGLRYALKNGGMMRTQLRALIRASGPCSNIRILFPMVVGQSELIEARELVNAIARLEGVPSPRIGAMIETPAAIFGLSAILEVVDFISIGTNDLAQYLFATNRQALDSVESGFALKPPMIEALHQIAAGCRRHDKPACVCGESAGDPFIAALLVGMGFRSLSMSPARAPAVRLALRSLHAGSLTDTANTCRSAATATEVERCLYDALPRKVREIARALHTPI